MTPAIHLSINCDLDNGHEGHHKMTSDGITAEWHATAQGRLVIDLLDGGEL